MEASNLPETQFKTIKKLSDNFNNKKASIKKDMETNNNNQKTARN